MARESAAELARWGAASVRESFASYRAAFREITRRARTRFEARDWRGTQADAHGLAAREPQPVEAIEVLTPVFFRGKGAYLVGRLRRGPLVSPLILALLHDELCLVTECNSREIPRAPHEEEEAGGGPWSYVEPNDVFPEEFTPFLRLPERLRAAFLAAHGEIVTAGFWRRMQARHAAGEIVDVFPYRETQRLRHVR
jgi:isocitrate dehydrogenase kinase/phosphatase